MPNYITCKLSGGLGNQLFQIIATHAIGWKVGLTPVFEKIDNNLSILNRPTYWDTIFNNIDTNLDKNLKFRDTKDSLPIVHAKFINKIGKLSKKHNIKLIGYFQTSQYYNLFAEKFNNLFNITHNDILDQYNNIANNNTITVSIHVRRGDYLKYNNTLDIEYYIHAINIIKSKLSNENIKFLVFSDDIPWCKTNFIGDNYYFVENITINTMPTDLSELLLMSKCNHNIIANSSFSWCSSMFNTNPHKIVIAPKKWFTTHKSNFGSNFENWISI